MTRPNALIGCAIAAGVVFVAAFVALSLGGSSQRPGLVLVSGLCLLVSAILLQLALSRVRVERLLPWWLRVGLPSLVMVAGLVAAAVWASATSTRTIGGWGLAGVCAFYLGAGQVLAEWRASRRWALWRGAVICAVCGTAFLAGVLLCLSTSPGWLLLAVLALFVGPVGLTLLSEDLMRLPVRDRAVRVGAALGAGLVIAGGVLLHVWTEIPTSFTWVLLAVLVGLVGAIASSTQADVLVVVTVIGLIWAAAAQGEDPAARPPPAGQPVVAALGDSYMSGEGAEVFFAGTNEPHTNECRRSATAYANVVVGRSHAEPSEHLAFFACSGAKAAHIHERPQWRAEPVDTTPEEGQHQASQLQALIDSARVDVRLVIVSIGGNDAGFATIGAACIAPGSCVERAGPWLAGLPEVGRRAEAAYRAVRKVVGGEAPIVAVPYPEPIRPTTCESSLLDRDEHRFLSGFVDQLNGVIEQAARDARVHYLEAMEDVFVGRMQICDGAPEKIGVNFIALDSVNALIRQADPSNWIHNSLHPNPRGHLAMAKVLEAWRTDNPNAPATPPPSNEPRFTPQSLDELMGPAPVSYCGGPGAQPDYCERDDDAWAVTRVGVVALKATPPALLVAAGALLIWLPVLAWTRPRWAKVGDWIARLLLGARRG